MEKIYRDIGVEWTIEENPIKFTRSKRICNCHKPKKYVYDCQKCIREFETTYEIHIPWCEDCRLEDINRLIKRK